ncbi:MAG: hypothetical protein KDJ88_10175 [Bauldia sp.]|nr:hypothetical protein [Bauldia sp.]
MANITFTSNLAVNPGLEQVLDGFGTPNPVSGTTFQIISNYGGQWDGFVFEVIGTGFAYDGSNEPTAGTFTSATLYKAVGGPIVATITGISGSLAGFWNELQTYGGTPALNLLLPSADTYQGGSSVDHLTQFGFAAFGDTLIGGGGDDILRAPQDATLVGDGGDDTFFLGLGSNGFETHFTVAGSAQDGSGGAGETNTVVVQKGGVVLDAVTDIDALEFFFSSLYVVFSPTQVGGGRLSNTLSIKGAGNTIHIDSGYESAPVTIDLSGWTFTSGSSSYQVIDTATFGSFSDDITGTSKSDLVATYKGNDVIRGGGGDDSIDGGAGADALYGGSGDDTIVADSEDTVIDGGADFDRLYLDLSSLTLAITVNPVLGTGVLADATVAFTGIESLAFFKSGSGNDVIDAGAGEGEIHGGAGNDSIDGGGGADQLYGDSGNDRLFSRLGEGGDGEILDGGDGTDFAFVDRSNKNRGLSLDLAESSIASVVGDGTTIVSIERIEFRSGSGNDVLTGGDLGDVILGNGGRDQISGRGGNDTLAGGDGLDIIDGGDGNDDIDGGDGIDFLSGDAGNDILNGGYGADLLAGGPGNDMLNGGNNADNLDGGSGNDELNGDNGADVIDGGDGDDVVQGGKGRDTIDGEGGNDTINGGMGRDNLTGGGGADIFYFDAPPKKSNGDMIEDFVVKEDTIYLDSAVFKGLKAGHLKNKAFEIGSKADDKKDRVIYDKNTGDLFHDRNGSKHGGMHKIADLDEGLHLTASDFFVV